MYGSNVLGGTVAGTVASTRSFQFTPSVVRLRCVTQRWAAPAPTSCWYSSPTVPALLIASATLVLLSTVRRSEADQVWPRSVEPRTCSVRIEFGRESHHATYTVELAFGSTAMDTEPPRRCCPVAVVPETMNGNDTPCATRRPGRLSLGSISAVNGLDPAPQRSSPTTTTSAEVMISVFAGKLPVRARHR